MATAQLVMKGIVVRPEKDKFYFINKKGDLYKVKANRGGKKGRKVATTTKEQVLKELHRKGKKIVKAKRK